MLYSHSQTDRFIVENDRIHEFLHRSRIRKVVRIQIILAQGDLIKCERGRTNPQKMQRKTATNIL